MTHDSATPTLPSGSLFRRFRRAGRPASEAGENGENAVPAPEEPSRRQWMVAAAGAATAVVAESVLRPSPAAAISANILDTGSDQTITGVKTFLRAPVVPAAAFPQTAVAGLVTGLAEKQAIIAEGTYPPTGSVVLKSIAGARGDLLVASGAGAVGRLPAGPNGFVLLADATAPMGLTWAEQGAEMALPLVKAATTNTRADIFHIQPSTPGVGSFSAGAVGTRFNSTYDYVFDIGYNPRRVVATEHSMTLTHEQDYEVGPGTHWCETYYEYTNRTGSFSFRPWFLVIDRDTDAIQNHVFSGSPFTWTTKEGVGIATLGEGGRFKLLGADPSFEGWAAPGRYFQIIGFSGGRRQWRLGGDADYSVSLSVNDIIAARFQAHAGHGGFLTLGTGTPLGKITSHSEHPTNPAGAFMRSGTGQTAPILAVYAEDESTEYAGFNRNGYPYMKKTSAPSDAELRTGELVLWFDSTNGAAKLMVKAKQADGSIRIGSVSLT